MLIEEVYRLFGVTNREDFIEELNKLVQVGTILEYQEYLEHLTALMMIGNATLIEKYFIRASLVVLSLS